MLLISRLCNSLSPGSDDILWTKACILPLGLDEDWLNILEFGWLGEKKKVNSILTHPASCSNKKGFNLHRNRANFPVLCRKWIIKAVFLSILIYGDVIYRNASASTLTPLYSRLLQLFHLSLYFVEGKTLSVYFEIP